MPDTSDIDLSNGSTNPYKVEMRHKLIPRCIHCGIFRNVILDGGDYFRHFVQGRGDVASNFPYLTLEQREILISGTHPECWAELFKDEEEVN